MKMQELEQLEKLLNEKIDVLQVLEEEKKELLNRGKNLSKTDFEKLQKDFAKSEIKYSLLFQEVKEIHKKVKKLKSEI